MALIGKIREKTKLLISIVSIGLVVFIGRELLGGLNSLTSSRQQVIGKVAGKTISLHTFQNQVEDAQRNFSMSYQQAPSEEISNLLKAQVWKQLTNEIIYSRLFNKLAITVGSDELVDMVQGSHIHADLKAAFTDPKTKEFSKKDLLAYLQNVAQLPAERQRDWSNFEQSLVFSRCQTKFDQLIKKSVFVTSLEAAQQFQMQQTTLALQYIYVPYQSIPKEGLTITDAMLQAYLDKHTADYMVEENKQIQYITLPILASEEDQAAFQHELQTLKKDLANTQEDVSFASIHTDASPMQVVLKYTENELPTALAGQKNNLKKGMVIGPVATGDSYKLYKVASITPGSTKKYEFIMIEKHLAPSDTTKEKCFREADDFIHQVKNTASFNKQATTNTWTIQNTSVNQKDTSIGKLSNARELVRWIHNEGKVGHVSPIFEIDKHYVIATITAHTKAGVSPIKQIKGELTHKVLNEQKGKIILEKITPLLHLSLSELASQYGNDAKVFSALQIKFSDSYLQGVGAASQAIGQAFGLQVGQRSQPIIDTNGVLVVEVTQRKTTPLPTTWEHEQREQAEKLQHQQVGKLSKALSEIAQLKDYRHKYY